jgi:hypothetical protein
MRSKVLAETAVTKLTGKCWLPAILRRSADRPRRKRRNLRKHFSSLI